MTTAQTIAPADAARLRELAAAGFDQIGAAAEHRDAALAQLSRWLGEELAIYHPQLRRLIERKAWGELLDAFYRVLPFGTGGRRGRVGIGPNRFNHHTLASSVQGHVDYLRAHGPGGELSVVIAFDVRCFHDFRGIYDGELPNPLLGMSSRDFARIATGVYVDNGVRVHLLPDEATRYVSTPQLSFAIRYLRASAGLNVSASHNHPDDNGGKVYNRHGGQMIPPDDEVMANFVEAARLPRLRAWDEVKHSGLISWLTGEENEAYLQMVLDQSLQPEARSARVVFTPLSGTAGGTVGAVLARAGFDLATVEAQREPDGTFANVPFRAPNPEVPESMQAGIELARERGADIVVACDPDADRIGICSRDRDGDYRFLNGNEITLLVTRYKLAQLRARGELPDKALVLKTFVTTDLLAPVVQDAGATLIGDLLVGFKYHANVLEQLEDTGRYQGIEARPEDFVLGVEESHGVLTSPQLRDKDAAGAALLLAELASELREQGRTLLDYLDEIYKRFGYYAAAPTSMVMTGATGLSAIQTIQRRLRAELPVIEGRHVERLTDYWDEARYGAFASTTDKVCRDIIAFRVDGARVIVRPSGTEPKTKLYVELPGQPLGADASDDALAANKLAQTQAAQAIADDFVLHMLSLIDRTLPRYALRISALVSLEDRADFAERVLPELLERSARQPDARELGAFIDQRLAGYGKDARGLVAPAVRAFLQEQRAASGSSAALDTLERAFFG